MTPTRRTGRAEAAPGGILLPALVVLCLGAAFDPLAAAAQEGCSDLNECELLYDAALSELAAEQSRGQVLDLELSRLLDSLTLARRAEDDARVQDLEARYYARSIDRDRLSRLERSRQEALDDRRADLLDALDLRLADIATELGGGPAPERQMALQLEARSIQRQYARLEEEGGNVLTPQVSLYPSITFDPRDTPQSLLSKAQFLERKAQQTLDELDVLDRQIKRVEDLQRTERALATGRAQLDRFDDRELPIGRATENRDPTRAAPADSTVLNLEELPLDERLRHLRSVREQTQRIYEDLLSRAASFRARISRGEGAP